MDPINTALCSFGMSGWVFHAPFINVNPEFNFYAVLERSKDLAKQKYPGVITYRTLEEMLADERVELVVVNTPNYTHYDYAKKALQADKHVIVEKPFTVAVSEGEELIGLSQKRNKKLSVYHNRRYDSDYRTVKKIIQEEWLGDIVESEMRFDRYRVELSAKVHKETPGAGTGALYDLGSHLIDQALQLFGMPDALFADIRIVRPTSKVDDYFELLLYYSKLRIKLKSSILVREPLPSYVFHGTKGSFIKPRTDIQENMLTAGKIPGSKEWGIEPDSEKGLLHTEKDGKIIKEHVSSLRGNYGDYYDDMYEAIRNAQPVPVDPGDGLNVIKIIEAAFKSNVQKKVIDMQTNR